VIVAELRQVSTRIGGALFPHKANSPLTMVYAGEH
jgi:hypothetical protein